MDWSWATEGVTEEVPRTTGPECINYMTNKRRWIEVVIFTGIFICIIRWAVKRLDPIIVPKNIEQYERHTPMRLLLLLAMTLIFGIEVGFKFAGKSVIFILNPCHIQTMVQIYLLASKPSKTTIALFRIQMNNLNGPFLAFLFPEVECRTLPFEQATYWIQHALLYIIPVYILKTGAYKIEDIMDYNWVTIGVMVMLLYHFVVLNAISIYTGINLNHMLCAAIADPFQGQNYRIAAVIHESILCPILNKVTVLLFCDDINHIFKRLPPIQVACKNQNVKYNNNSQRQRQNPAHVYQRDNNVITVKAEVERMSDAVMVTESCALSCDLTAAKHKVNDTVTAPAAAAAATTMYHQKQLTPTEQLSLAAELAAALATTTTTTATTAATAYSNATARTLRHRHLRHPQSYQHDLYDFENVINDVGDDGGDVDDDVISARSMPVLDRELLLLQQQQQQQQQQLETDSNLEMNMEMHNIDSSSGNIIVDYSTMPTTKID